MSDNAPIRGHFVLTYRDQLNAVWSQSRVLRVCAILLAVCFVFVLMVEIVNRLVGAESSMLELLGLLVLFAGVWPLMIAVAVWRLSPQQKDVSYAIDGERIVMRDAAGNELSSPWTEVKACREGKSGFTLAVGPMGRWLAKRAFDAPGLSAYRVLARERLGKRARLLEKA